MYNIEMFNIHGKKKVWINMYYDPVTLVLNKYICKVYI